ncbi:cytosolic iron-sulfur assembly component galla-1 isoform X2 [Amblyomma americanum]
MWPSFRPAVAAFGFAADRSAGRTVKVLRPQLQNAVASAAVTAGLQEMLTTSLAGLCVRAKLEENLPYNFKLDIFIKEGSHTTAAELTKQINDKERVAAAMENKNIRDMVCNCVSYETV